jgi:hypothetical protein
MHSVRQNTPFAPARNASTTKSSFPPASALDEHILTKKRYKRDKKPSRARKGFAIINS